MEKEGQIGIKDLGEEDWRGILATIITVGGMAIIGICVVVNRLEPVMPIVGLMMLVAGWYFKSKESSQK